MREKRDGRWNIRHLICFLLAVLINDFHTLCSLLNAQSPHLEQMDTKKDTKSSSLQLDCECMNRVFETLKKHYLLHEKKNFITPTPNVVLNFLELHLHEILQSLGPFYDAEIAAESYLVLGTIK